MDVFASRRRLALVGVPLVVVLVAAFWWFRPDALVTARTVDEELDPALVDDDGDLQLSLVDLDTSNGPDLRDILSAKVGEGGDWYGYADGATELGRLKGNRGTQLYDVPDGLDVDQVASAVIWCERFAVGFGAANLG